MTVTLTGTSGTFSVNMTVGESFVYTPATNGSLVILVDDSSLFLPAWTVRDSDDVELYTDSDGELGVVWTAGEQMRLSVVPATGEDPNQTIAFAWSYAARASSRLQVVLDTDEVQETPGGLMVSISNATVLDTVTFSLVGPSSYVDFQTVQLNENGQIDDYMLELPGLIAGDYLLRVEGVSSGAEEVTFTALEDALLNSGTDPKPYPTPPTRDPSLKWRFMDLRNPTTVNYTFLNNPKAWSNVHPPNDFTHDNTTAPDGQILSWQAGARPWRMEFNGYFETEAEYNAFVFWSELRRRFWLIDHRDRAWLITCEQFDARPRIVPNRKWAHDYTMKTLVFLQGATD